MALTAVVGARALQSWKRTETKMKVIMAALTAAGLMTGIAAPASAGTDLTAVEGEYMQAPSAAAIKRVKMRRYVTRQIEYDANKLPVGTGIWWQQMDRESRGGRR